MGIFGCILEDVLTKWQQYTTLDKEYYLMLYKIMEDFSV